MYELLPRGMKLTVCPGSPWGRFESTLQVARPLAHCTRHTTKTGDVDEQLCVNWLFNVARERGLFRSKNFSIAHTHKFACLSPTKESDTIPTRTHMTAF